MAELVNLNRLRKAKKREDDARQAEVNRAKFGRTKAEKARDLAEVTKLEAELDGKKVEE